MSPLDLQLLLATAAVAVALIGVAAYLPARWKWQKMALLVLAAIVGQSVVSVGLDLAREEGARARATRDSLRHYLEGLRAQGIGELPAEADLARALPRPPLDGWGNESRLERHEGLLLAWSYGQDGVRDYDHPPPSCLDRARPYHDIILGIDQKGAIRRLQVPGVSGDPDCTRAPDRAAPGYFYPAMGAQAVLLLLFFSRLWQQLKPLSREGSPVDGAGEAPAPGALDTQIPHQVFRWKHPSATYGGLVLGATIATAAATPLARVMAALGGEGLGEIPGAALLASPWTVLAFNAGCLVLALATLPREVRFEAGELRLSALGGGECVPSGSELALIKLGRGIYVVGRRSLAVTPLFERADLLAELLERRARPRA